MSSPKQQNPNHILPSLSLSMETSKFCSSFTCELRIIQAKNMETYSLGNFFIRVYLFAGSNQRVQLNTKELPPNDSDDRVWSESFSLECIGDNEDSINSLKQQTICFELRRRKRTKRPAILGKIGGSKSELLGRAEMPWKNAFESPNIEIENWVSFVLKNKHVVEEVKPPKVKVTMKVKLPTSDEMKKLRRDTRLKNLKDCGCTKGYVCNCSDYKNYDYYDVFALGAGLEAL